MDFCDEFYFGHAFIVFALACGRHDVMKGGTEGRGLLVVER